MTKSFPPRPTQKPAPASDEFYSLCEVHAIDPTTLLSLPIPEGKLVVFKTESTKFPSGHRIRGGFHFIDPSALMDYMVEGFEMIPHDTYYKRDEANPNLVSKEEPKVEKAEKPSSTKEEIHTALSSDDNVNAAIAYLGDMQTADELSEGDTKHLNGKGFSAAYGKTGRHLWIWVTGKDSRNNFEVKWEPKSLAHSRADRTFSKFTRNYDEIETAIDLGRHIAKIHWKQLSFLVADDYKATVLPVADKPRPKVEKKNTPPAMFELTGAKVLRKSGKATQFRWDSRKVWLPNSQLKMVGGKLQVPVWLAKKNGMI